MTKTQLLGTTALVTTSLLASPATAQIEMRLGGYHEQWFGFGNNEDRFNLQDVDQWSNSEIFFLGQGITQNGLTFGVNIQLEGNTVGDQIDESFLFLSGGFGRINLGSENSAGYLMQASAPNVGIPINTGWITQHIANPTGTGMFRQPFGSTFIEPAGDNDGQKVTYFTPPFSGVQLGVSYLPDIDPTGGDRNALVTDTENYTNGVSVGANYTAGFDGIDILIAGGFFYAAAPNDVGTVTGSDGSTIDLDENFIGYSAGVSVTLGGFEIGGSMAQVIDGRLTTSDTTTVGVGDGTTTLTAPAGTTFVRSSEGIAFEVGAAYAQDAWSVSATYFRGESEGLLDVPGEDEFETYLASGRYDLGAGLSIAASLGFAGFDSELTGATGDFDNDGFLASIGVLISL